MDRPAEVTSPAGRIRRPGLERVLGVPEDDLDDIGWRGGNAGQQLLSQGAGGTDTRGFDARTSGYLNLMGQPEDGRAAYFWTRTVEDGGRYYRKLQPDQSGIYRGHERGENLYKVRCLVTN